MAPSLSIRKSVFIIFSSIHALTSVTAVLERERFFDPYCWVLGVVLGPGSRDGLLSTVVDDGPFVFTCGNCFSLASLLWNSFPQVELKKECVYGRDMGNVEDAVGGNAA